MTTRLNRPVSAKWIAEGLGLELFGQDREISELCILEGLDQDGLSFVLRGNPPEGLAGGTVFAPPSAAVPGLTVIGSANPRLDFIRAQYLLESSPGFATVSPPPRIHPTARLGAGAVVENGVEIGEGTRVGPNVVIRTGTRIGRFCEIKGGAVIGEPGFGFERDADERPLKMIHLGGVCIGDYVEIGALNTICRGALGETILADYVKTDDHVHIAHNCRIGEGTLITACAELSGSVIVGKKVWIAPNCSIAQKLRIGDGAFVGIGAVVLRDVEPGAKVFGNPAKPLLGGFRARKAQPKAPDAGAGNP